jgi:hypothetical protein
MTVTLKIRGSTSFRQCLGHIFITMDEKRDIQHIFGLHQVQKYRYDHFSAND